MDRPSDTPLAPLVAPPAATRRARAEGDRARGEGDAPRVARLWEAIRRTRAELEARQRREERIRELFDREIRPRERAFTTAVCHLTEHLVTHHESTRLAADERALLGLWIDENLRGLGTHPFAPRPAADALDRRWRLHLRAARHPLDAPLASLRARRDGSIDEDPLGTEKRSDRRGGTGGARDGGRPRADGDAEAASGHRQGHRPEPGGGGDGDAVSREPERIVSRLFRRLARALHPDREPDEARRRDKHDLMSDCLRARDERDIDTLLSLYVAHVGALPDDIVDDDPAELARLLARQLDALRRRLGRRGEGLAATIVARYAADGQVESERRVAVHADALDEETTRVVELGRRLGSVEGLHEALLSRRALELDRLAIDELTGMTSG